MSEIVVYSKIVLLTLVVAFFGIFLPVVGWNKFETRRLRARFREIAEKHRWKFIDDVSLLSLPALRVVGSLGDHEVTILNKQGGSSMIDIAGVLTPVSTFHTAIVVRGPQAGQLTQTRLRERLPRLQLCAKPPDVSGQVIIVLNFILTSPRRREKLDRLLGALRELLT